MRILVFDTETSGLNPQWNVILQLSYQIVDSESWETVKTVNHYFSWPDDESRITPDAIRVNGLTKDVLSQKPLSDRKPALEEFVSDKDSCDLLVAHNLEFDKKFIIASCREEGVKYANSGWSQSYDTMKRTTNFCQIPKAYGTGYKWPKLIELAGCLHIDLSDIALHDSSGDVELTKRCFVQLVRSGVYSLPQQSDLTVTLHVESADELNFVVKRNGEPVSQSVIDSISKKNWNAACQELIKNWSEENEEERSSLIGIYRKSPKLKTEEDFRVAIDDIKPASYTRKAFEEQEPTRNDVREALEREAERVVTSWMFWTLKKKREEYVESRLESTYQQKLVGYKQRLARHEESEDQAEKEYNKQSLKRCEERKQKMAAIIDGSDKDLIEKEMLRIPDAMGLSFPCHTESRLEGTTISAKLSLLHPKDFPHLEGVRLTSGNYKIKEIPEKVRRNEYTACVWGAAFCAAAHCFNVSPKISDVVVEGEVDAEGSDKITLYKIAFDRSTFGAQNWEELEIGRALSLFPISEDIKKEVLDELFVKKDSEPIQESQALPNYMRDSLFNEVARFVFTEKSISTAMIQRRFELGYNRGGAIMDQLEKAGIVGPMGEDKLREVLIKDEHELERILG